MEIKKSQKHKIHKDKHKIKKTHKLKKKQSIKSTEKKQYNPKDDGAITVNYTSEQDGGGIIDWFRNIKKRAVLRKLQKIFKTIKTITINFAKPEKKLKLFIEELTKLLNDHIEEVDTLMYRYQELVMFEKKKSYLTAMSVKSPIQANDPDFYSSQTKELDVQVMKVNNYIKEHQKKKEVKEKRIAELRVKLEKEKAQLEKKNYVKAEAEFKKYSENADLIENIRIQLDKHKTYQKLKKSEQDKEMKSEIAESARYYKVFNSFFIDSETVNNAYKIYQAVVEHLSQADILEASFNDINKQFQEQTKQYDNIKGPLQKIFHDIIPNIISRIRGLKLGEVINTTDLILRDIGMAGIPGEKIIKPLLELIKKTIEQSVKIQSSINLEIDNIRDMLFSINPQGKDLSRNLEYCIFFNENSLLYIQTSLSASKNLIEEINKLSMYGGGKKSKSRKKNMIGGVANEIEYADLQDDFLYEMIRQIPIPFTRQLTFYDIGNKFIDDPRFFGSINVPEFVPIVRFSKRTGTAVAPTTIGITLNKGTTLDNLLNPVASFKGPLADIRNLEHLEKQLQTTGSDPTLSADIDRLKAKIATYESLRKQKITDAATQKTTQIQKIVDALARAKAAQAKAEQSVVDIESLLLTISPTDTNLNNDVQEIKGHAIDEKDNAIKAVQKVEAALIKAQGIIVMDNIITAVNEAEAAAIEAEAAAIEAEAAAKKAEQQSLMAKQEVEGPAPPAPALPAPAPDPALPAPALPAPALPAPALPAPAPAGAAAAAAAGAAAVAAAAPAAAAGLMAAAAADAAAAAVAAAVAAAAATNPGTVPVPDIVNAAVNYVTQAGTAANHVVLAATNIAAATALSNGLKPDVAAVMAATAAAAAIVAPGGTVVNPAVLSAAAIAATSAIGAGPLVASTAAANIAAAAVGAAGLGTNSTVVSAVTAAATTALTTSLGTGLSPIAAAAAAVSAAAVAVAAATASSSGTVTATLTPISKKWVPIFVLSNFERIAQEAYIKYQQQKKQEQLQLQLQQLQGLQSGSQIGMYGQNYPIMQPGAFGVSPTYGTVKQIPEELKDIITRLKENLSSVSTMIEILSKAIEGIKHQSKDLRDLLIHFREMEKIQSKISGFKSRIKFPKIEKAVPFVIREIKQSKETPTLSQIASSSEYQNLEKKLQTELGNIIPNFKTQYAREVDMDPTRGIVSGTPWLGSLIDLKSAGQTMGYGYPTGIGTGIGIGTGNGMFSSPTQMSGPAAIYAAGLKSSDRTSVLMSIKNNLPKLMKLGNDVDPTDFFRLLDDKNRDESLVLDDQKAAYNILTTTNGLKWLETDKGILWSANNYNQPVFNAIIVALRSQPQNSLYPEKAEQLVKIVNEYKTNKAGQTAIEKLMTAQALQQGAMAGQMGYQSPFPKVT
jgi:hypothetical protein